MMRWIAYALVFAVPAARADALLDDGSGASGATANAGSGAGSTIPPNDAADMVSWAGAPSAITLPELLQIAVHKSPALQSATIDIAIAEAQVAETWQRRDWTLTTQVFGAYLGATVTSGLLNSPTTMYGAIGDLTRTLPTGGIVDFHFGSQYEKTGNSLNGPVESRYWNSVITGSLTQPLLRGGGTKLYNAGERKAELVRDAAQLERRLVALQTIQAVLADYWDLVLAEQEVAIEEEGLAIAKERLRVTQIEVSTGHSAPSEMSPVEQTIAATEEQVLSGELAVLDASLVLRRAVGMHMGAGDLGLRVPTDLATNVEPLDLAVLIERTCSASPQLAELAKHDASAAIDIYVTENGLLPQLDLALTVGPNSTEAAFAGTARDAVEFKSYEVAASLTFSRSLHQYDLRHRALELQQGRRKLRVTAEDVRLQLVQAISHAVGAIEIAKRRVAANNREVALAKDNVRIEIDRFAAGRATNFDVMLRLDQQSQAKLRRVEALIEWHKAETIMWMLTGDLLPMYGIEIR